MSFSLEEILPNSVASQLPLQIRTSQVTGICSDSRQVNPGELFFSVAQNPDLDRSFISMAFARGAKFCVVEGNAAFAQQELNLIQVKNVRAILGQTAHRFNAEPSQGMFAVGVTGTNGKTSVAWILAHALKVLNSGPALYLGTLGYANFTAQSSAFKLQEIANTTPDAISTQRILRENFERGAKSLVMEVSSHGLDQYRAHAIQWDGCVFTNLTRDHLDYHQTMEAYGAAKAKLFLEELLESSKAKKFAALNIADSFGQTLASRISKNIKLVSYALDGQADVTLETAEERTDGTEIHAKFADSSFTIKSMLLGHYNVENMLAAVALLLAAGYEITQIVRALALVPCVPGRLELISSQAEPKIFVDYAHTPDALERAQDALRRLKPKRLVTVFGCGGNRDRGKRPLMTQAVLRYADYFFITSDNPRDEDPEQIIADCLAGLGEDASGRFETEVCRELAIKKAVEFCTPGDVLLIAGKGHETYQEIRGKKHHFSDQEICRKLLQL
ncbi:UDP-N-acetylmuramoyl-L-alanyl-D-glutamate--2,6-diaminopimelate ligase [bacterium]|nr:UDP-N-acetylmuramoyl-L-alanyl-D-glutamate--2,6-diaminopimelate ligase [bacterium]